MNRSWDDRENDARLFVAHFGAVAFAERTEPLQVVAGGAADALVDGVFQGPVVLEQSSVPHQQPQTSVHQIKIIKAIDIFSIERNLGTTE